MTETCLGIEVSGAPFGYAELYADKSQCSMIESLPVASFMSDAVTS